MLLIDDYSIMTWVTFLKEKSEALDRFMIFNSMVENQIGGIIKCLRSDSGKFTSNEFHKFCEEYFIRRHFFLFEDSSKEWCN